MSTSIFRVFFVPPHLEPVVVTRMLRPTPLGSAGKLDGLSCTWSKSIDLIFFIRQQYFLAPMYGTSWCKGSGVARSTKYRNSCWNVRIVKDPLHLDWCRHLSAKLKLTRMVRKDKCHCSSLPSLNLATMKHREFGTDRHCLKIGKSIVSLQYLSWDHSPPPHRCWASLAGAAAPRWRGHRRCHMGSRRVFPGVLQQHQPAVACCSL